MEIKKVVLWLLAVGILTLIIGGTIGILTFDSEEFEMQINSGSLGSIYVDEHGCFIAGGYRWCEPKQKCLVPWKESCQ